MRLASASSQLGTGCNTKKNKFKYGGRHRLYKKRAIYDLTIGITDPLPGYPAHTESVLSVSTFRVSKNMSSVCKRVKVKQ